MGHLKITSLRPAFKIKGGNEHEQEPLVRVTLNTTLSDLRMKQPKIRLRFNI